MNEIQKHLVFMLQEIDEICSKNGIPYILGGRTAKDACQNKNFLGEYIYASVMMRGQDFDKFCALVEKKEGRAIESIRNNPYFPGGMAMRYVDETTTFIYGDSAHAYKHKGIYVTINKCRNIPRNKYKAKLANGIEKTIDYAGITDLSSLGEKKQKVVKLLRAIIKLFGKSFVVNTLLNLQNRLVKQNNGYLAYVRSFKDNINLPATMFTKVKKVSFGGASFNVPSDTDKYLELVYSKKWKDDKKQEGVSAKHLLVASTEVSYKEIDTDSALYAKREEVSEIIETRKHLSEQVGMLRKKIESYWDILFLTQERYRLYRLYRPVLEILREHYVNKDFAWLNIAMKDYLDTVKTYLGKEWPVVVCPELDEIVLAMLDHAGDYKSVKRFEDLKKRTSFKPIRLTLGAEAMETAQLNLPATIAVDAENVVPVFLRDGEDLLPVVRLGADGEKHPLLLKSGSNVIEAPVGVELVNENGANDVFVWDIAVEGKDGTAELLFGSEWKQRVFENRSMVSLVQHIYGRDLEIAWLASDETVYVTSKFADCNQYATVSAPVYCKFDSNLTVPVRFEDEPGVMRELFCLEEDGRHTPVVTLGAGGVFWVAPDAGKRLYYLTEDGSAEKLDVSRFIDDANEDIKATLFKERGAKVCCKLVQEDMFGRVLEIAELYDDESVQPVARMNADGTLTALPKENRAYSTLCLKQSDGTTTTLATIDPEGKIVTALPAQQILPVGVLITRPLTRYQTYAIGGQDGDVSFHTTGYAL